MREMFLYLFFISYFLPIKILYSSLYNSPTKTHIFCIVKYKTKSENDGCISRDHFSLTIEKKNLEYKKSSMICQCRNIVFWGSWGAIDPASEPLYTPS